MDLGEMLMDALMLYMKEVKVVIEDQPSESLGHDMDETTRSHEVSFEQGEPPI